MHDLLSMLATCHRPRLMMKAARIGAEDYRRSVHLPRILGYGKTPRHGPALIQLMEMESAMETLRTTSDPNYRLVRHIEVLIAMVGEARALRASMLS